MVLNWHLDVSNRIESNPDYWTWICKQQADADCVKMMKRDLIDQQLLY